MDKMHAIRRFLRDLIRFKGERILPLDKILFAMLILALVGMIPIWPHSISWGYIPSIIVGIVMIFFVVMLVSKRV